MRDPNMPDSVRLREACRWVEHVRGEVYSLRKENDGGVVYEIKEGTLDMLWELVNSQKGNSHAQWNDSDKR